MRIRLDMALVVLLASTLLITGCSQAAPAPAPTAAPAKPAAAPTTAPAAAPAPTTAPAAPTAAPAAPTKAPQPTAAPAKVDFPSKGRPITTIVAQTAGGGTDILARGLSGLMEKDLGVPIQILNKPGAGSQVGTTEGLAAKPDGYTLVYMSTPSSFGVYLDPDRKATYGRKDIQIIAQLTEGPNVMLVPKDSPYKTAKDLIDDAKANPGKIKMGTNGYLGVTHLGVVDFERAVGVKFTKVHFEGGAPTVTALMGSHIDLAFPSIPECLGQIKAGDLRPLALLDKRQHPSLPDVKTLESQGYPAYVSYATFLAAPAGIPREYVDIIANSVKKAVEDADFKKRSVDLGQDVAFKGPTEASADWDRRESATRPLLDLAKKDAK